MAAQFTISPDGIAHFKRADPPPKPEPPPRRPRDRLDWLVKRDHIRPEHAEMGERLLKLHETRMREPSPRMHFDQGAGGGGVSAVLGRLTARTKWERLFAVVGPAGEALVTCVILDGKSLAETAEELNLHPKAVLPMLQLVLDILERS